MSEAVYTLTAPSGRMLTIRGDVAELAETPNDSTVYLTFETAAGSTVKFTYKISDGEAIQEIADNITDLLEKVLSLQLQELLQMMQARGESE